MVHGPMKGPYCRYMNTFTNNITNNSENACAIKDACEDLVRISAGSRVEASPWQHHPSAITIWFNVLGWTLYAEMMWTMIDKYVLYTFSVFSLSLCIYKYIYIYIFYIHIYKIWIYIYIYILCTHIMWYSYYYSWILLIY